MLFRGFLVWLEVVLGNDCFWVGVEVVHEFTLDISCGFR